MGVGASVGAEALDFGRRLPCTNADWLLLHCANAKMPGLACGDTFGFRPGGRPCRMALRVRSAARICRAAPSSLRYAPLRQGARSLILKSLRDARQNLRSSLMQKGHSQEHGSLRVASEGAALRAGTYQVDDLKVGACLYIQDLILPLAPTFLAWAGARLSPPAAAIAVGLNYLAATGTSTVSASFSNASSSGMKRFKPAVAERS